MSKLDIIVSEYKYVLLTIFLLAKLFKKVYIGGFVANGKEDNSI